MVDVDKQEEKTKEKQEVKGMKEKKLKSSSCENWSCTLAQRNPERVDEMVTEVISVQ